MRPVFALLEQNSDNFLWDFGRIKQGEVVNHDFTFKNTGKGILNIKDVRTSCGCTASEAGKKVLAAGESTSIKVKFNSAGYLGPVEKFVYVATDALVNPISKYVIKAEVVKE